MIRQVQSIRAADVAQALACGKRGCRCGRRNGTELLTHCPAHNDGKPSLSVKDGDGGGVLVRCHAGCPQDAVVAALRERRLWPQRRDGRRQSNTREVRYQVRDVGGAVIAIHVRRDGPAGKCLWWEMPDGSKDLGGKRVEELPLYGSERLGALADGSSVVVEGEKAADALVQRGIVAVGTVTGAAATPGLDALRSLLGRPVLLWPDADDAGRHHMDRLAERLWVMGHHDLLVVEWPQAPPGGDSADFPGEDATLRALLEAARPWMPPPSVDLAALLDGVRAFMRRYVVMAPAQADAVALWVAHTWAFDAWDATAYLHVSSPEKRSGKTRLLESLALVAARAWFTGRVTPAVLVRKVAAETPTLLLDESDAAFHGDKEYAEALRGLLNSGHRRGGVASLCLRKGGEIGFADFHVFCPKAIAGIGKLPDTVADRAIPVLLKRRAAHEPVERFRRREAEDQGAQIREKLGRWAGVTVQALADARPAIPVELDDRAADGWEPLLAIADLAGGSWPERARTAALALSSGDWREDDSLGVRLLRDIRVTFGEKGTDRLASADLVAALVTMEEAPWGDLRGRPLDARTLARLLRSYDNIRPRTIRLRLDGTETVKGYCREWFGDAWARYLSHGETSQAADSDSGVVTDVTDVTVNPRVQAHLPEDSCGLCGTPAEGYTPEGEPRCAAHCVRATDGPLVRSAIEQLGLPIVARRRAEEAGDGG